MSDFEHLVNSNVDMYTDAFLYASKKWLYLCSQTFGQV